MTPVKPVKRSFSIAGHRTSISLETPFWEALHELADASGVSLAQYVADIDSRRGRTNLSSAVRVHILAHYRRYATQKPQT
jgi:predicted DNA-binding ribbon-helix-helix protein